mmetsp:Transcript_34549/g.81457  ORF Transcript_34549/g.81457 Transcript_34549/m.81457 type:complete len:181 (-) Transcript_34549:200-742(-)
MSHLSQATKPKKEAHDTIASYSKRNSIVLSRAAFHFRPLPPSLTKLPETSNISISRGSSILDIALDELLERLSKNTPQTQPPNEEQSISEVTASDSTASLTTVVSSVPSTSSLSSLTSSGTKSKHNVRFDEQNDTTPRSFPPRPNKKRRFQRRNSFVVRDLAELSRFAELSEFSGGSQEI